MSTDIRIHDLADERFAWPGGYAIFFVTDDGGVLCSPCVVDNWDDTIRDADTGDGWKIEASDHTGNCDDIPTCDHCYKLVDEPRQRETTT